MKNAPEVTQSHSHVPERILIGTGSIFQPVSGLVMKSDCQMHAKMTKVIHKRLAHVPKTQREPILTAPSFDQSG